MLAANRLQRRLYAKVPLRVLTYLVQIYSLFVQLLNKKTLMLAHKNQRTTLSLVTSRAADPMHVGIYLVGNVELDDPVN